MRKNIVTIFICMVSISFILGFFTGCSKTVKESSDNLKDQKDAVHARVTFGKVLEVSGDSCLVKITDKPYDFSIGDQVRVYYSSIYQQGEEKEGVLNNDYKVKELPEGSLVTITYFESMNEGEKKSISTRYITIVKK